jgi:hypothetical protein
VVSLKLLQEGDMEDIMNLSVLRQLQSIRHETDALQNFIWPEEFQPQLVLSPCSDCRCQPLVEAKPDSIAHLELELVVESLLNLSEESVGTTTLEVAVVRRPPRTVWASTSTKRTCCSSTLPRPANGASCDSARALKVNGDNFVGDI